MATAGPPRADVERLPGMTPADEVKENQRLEDVRNFRQFLVDTRSVKCLMKLFQHTAQHEMRLDNPRLVKDFLASYQDDGPEARLRADLERERDGLLEARRRLEAQVRDLEEQRDCSQRIIASRKLWKAMMPETPAEAEEGPVVEAGDGGCDGDAADGEEPKSPSSTPALVLTLGALFQRVCGRKGEVLLLRPPQLAKSLYVEIGSDAFCAWAAWLPDEVRAWCEETLLPKLLDVPAGGGAFEQELVQVVRDTGYYPKQKAKVPAAVALDPGLSAFLEAASARFATSAVEEDEDVDE